MKILRLKRVGLPLVLGAFLSCGSGTTTAPVGQAPPPAPPAPPTSAGATTAILYTTLDGPTAVATPSAGVGSGATITSSPTNDFVAARVANGFHADAIGERILMRQVDGTRQNVELERGTLDFWYRPAYDHDDNTKYTIAGTGSWGFPPAPGSLHFGKHNASNNNDIFLIFFNAAGVRYEHNVRANAYSWNAGDWVRVRITWDFGVAPGVQNLHLYLNGTEVPLVSQVSRGPQAVPAEKSTEMLYIGARDRAGSIPPNGIYDEVRIWDRVVPPA